MCTTPCIILSFFFNDTATTEIYTLSLHDALPILLIEKLGLEDCVQFVHGISDAELVEVMGSAELACVPSLYEGFSLDRKSTRLNSSHANISYAVFCLKKKKEYLPAEYRILERLHT